MNLPYVPRETRQRRERRHGFFQPSAASPVTLVFRVGRIDRFEMRLDMSRTFLDAVIDTVCYFLELPIARVPTALVYLFVQLQFISMFRYKLLRSEKAIIFKTYHSIYEM